MFAVNSVPRATWEAFEYEVEMFVHISELRRRPKVDQLLQNALVETSLLHIRILSEVLLDKGNRPDDILLSMLIPPPVDPLLAKALDELRLAYGTSHDAGSPCSEINKRLAHLTRARGPRYDYSAVFATMEPALEQVLCLVAEVTARRKLQLLTRR